MWRKVRTCSGYSHCYPALYFNRALCFSASNAAAEDEEELKKAAVVNWYLKEIESEIESEEELINKKGLIEKVIHRLVHYVSQPSLNV